LSILKPVNILSLVSHSILEENIAFKSMGSLKRYVNNSSQEVMPPILQTELNRTVTKCST